MSNPDGKAPRMVLNIAGRIAAIAAILVLAMVGASALRNMKEPPAQAVVEESALSVEAIKVQPEDVPVVISGYGEVRVLNTVQITPEVAGVVVEAHPRLDAGEVVAKGELLFRIDPRNYAAALDQAQASVAQGESTVARLQEQERLDRDRLGTLARSSDLAGNELDRVKTLFEQDEVGTKAGVEQAEVRFNQAKDAHDQLDQMVTLYDKRLAEAKSALAAAEAQVELAQANLARTEVRAPFIARIKTANVELGQYVAPGAPVLTLADDSTLEISVSLDSIDARKWLQFTETPTAESAAWFNKPEPVTCKIYWTEEPSAHTWYGRLDRVQSFDPASRTMTVAIRVSGDEAAAPEGESLPLVEGMYCQVAIPGKTMEDVFRVPRWAVTFDGKTYVSENNRLQVREVAVVRTQDEETLVSGGLAPEDTVIVTRLVNPLPNSLLDVAVFEETKEKP